MLVYKNTKSGQYLIYLNDSNSDEVQLISPTGDIVSLNKSLLTDPIEYSKDELYEKGIITPEQVKSFDEYTKPKNNDVIDDVVSRFGRMSSEEQKQFIEQLGEMLEEEGIVDKE